MNVPATDGVPLIVTVLLAQVAVTPVGNPVATPIPVAPVVAIVMLGESGVLIQIVRGAGAAAVLAAITVIEPVAATLPQPPLSGIL